MRRFQSLSGFQKEAIAVAETFAVFFRNCSAVQQTSIRETALSLGLDRLLEIVLLEQDEVR